MPKAQNEISREDTARFCSECDGAIVRASWEIDDGQGAGGSFSMTGLWCDQCRECKETRDTYLVTPEEIAKRFIGSGEYVEMRRERLAAAIRHYSTPSEDVIQATTERICRFVNSEPDWLDLRGDDEVIGDILRKAFVRDGKTETNSGS